MTVQELITLLQDIQTPNARVQVYIPECLEALPITGIVYCGETVELTYDDL